MPEFDSTVEYRPIPDAPGYMVGSDGSVWTEWWLRAKPVGRGSERFRSGNWRQLKPTRGAGSKGYEYFTVSIVRGGKMKPCCIHILVLETFVGPCPPDMWGRHHDGNRANNRRDNLSWATPKENHADRVAHGTHLRGETNGNAKLSADDVRQIRALYEQGELQKDIAERFGMSKTQIHRILRGDRWQYLT